MQCIEVTYNAEDGLLLSFFLPWRAIEKRMIYPFIRELRNKPDVIRRLRARGCKTEMDCMKEYLICFYGGTDNRIDLDGGRMTSDYCHCGCRGHCPDENFPGLCSRPVVGRAKLSPSELRNLQLSANDYGSKQIADMRHRSLFTIQAQQRIIREKLEVHGMAGAVAMGIVSGVLNNKLITNEHNKTVARKGDPVLFTRW